MRVSARGWVAIPAFSFQGLTFQAFTDNLRIMDYVLCSQCGFPIAFTRVGQRISCPFCHNIGVVAVAVAGKEDDMIQAIRNSYPISQEGTVAVPAWLTWGTVGFVLGLIAGPIVLASTREGAQKLARMAEEKLRK